MLRVLRHVLPLHDQVLSILVSYIALHKKCAALLKIMINVQRPQSDTF